MQIIDCDYIEDYKGSFYIVKGYWNKDYVLCNKVFSPDEKGDRYNPATKKCYSKVITSNFDTEKVELSNIKTIFKPKESFQKLKSSLSGVWDKIPNELIKLGIQEDKIGIFGSLLLGFDVKKDVDFVIYGKENWKILKDNIKEFKKRVGAEDIREDYIPRQIKKYGAFHSLESNSFDRLLKNKWTSLQITPELLSTIRFVYEDNEARENYFENPVLKEEIIEGEVIEDSGADFCPREFDIKTDKGDYKVATYYWVYQSCVRNGMRVRVKANLRTNKILTIDKSNQGIIIL